MKKISIKGVASHIPQKKVSNDELSHLMNTSDEWITSRTGIKNRYISSGEDTSYMAAKASEKAIQNANISPDDIDLIIVATATPDSFVPSTACIVQKYIKADNALAFDISAACTGFVFGIDIAISMMKSHNFKNALVIGSETLSKSVDWKDRGTCVLFGDGAGAIVLSIDEEIGIINTICKSEGKKGDVLVMEANDVENPFVEKVKYKNKKLQMNGGEVFKFATSIITKIINEVLESSNMTIEEIDYIVPHQANVKIIEYAAKRLGVPKDKFYINIEKYGNTSSASIPIALSEMHKENIIKKNDKILLVAFGGGLTYGASIINWNI